MYKPPIEIVMKEVFQKMNEDFENAVFIYNKATALSVKQDMLNNFEAGHEVTADYTKDVIKPLRLGVCMLRMISPLL